MTSGLPWGLALASGVNTYLPLFLLALFARYSHVVHLSARFQFLISPPALVILGLLAACEILAQKFPGLDNLWDLLHSLLRPLAGAVAAGATLSTSSVFEMALAMAAGGTLAAAAHSAKTGIRLATSVKTLGAANFGMSLVEDFAVLAATLLSVFDPRVMLAVVAVFLLLFVWLAPPIARHLSFRYDLAAGWFRWLGMKLRRAPLPQDLKATLWLVPPGSLESVKEQLAPPTAGEELLGIIGGWQRTKRGPRRAWLVLTSRRCIILDLRRFRRPAPIRIDYGGLQAINLKNLLILHKASIQTHGGQEFVFIFRKDAAPLVDQAVQKMIELAQPPVGAETVLD
ncbi:MAG TPA: DUF4126 domain-containing protein [Terriglobia bacterium]|nr:DUF4126 domain-containing protein [Terriglobia bacterium]